MKFAAPIVVCCLMVALVRPAIAQLSPEGELKTLQAADGMEVSLFASEPLITNPAAIDVDTRGRVWVAEIQWYRASAKTPPADKIKVLEDTDGDGVADKVTVFAEDVFAPMSICVAGTKVFVATSPDLWMYEDRDGDLKADGPPQKVLTGFGGQNHDHGAHSLVLGPDHKWWMSHGDGGFDVTGTDGSHIKYKWGAMLRGELDGSQLETIAVNFRNPYELCVSSFGETFVSDNDNDGNESVRICWIMDGGNYGWFGGPPFGKGELAGRLSEDTPFRAHWHFRGFVPGFVPATLVTGFGSPTGICFYEGDAFGAKYKNVPLHTDCGPRECRAYRHTPSGYGMTATSEVFLSNKGDNYFRPDDICTGPEGQLYVADWYDGGVGGHGYNNPNQGRIFLLKPKDKPLARREKSGPYDNTADAIVGLQSPNLATQYLARERLLADGQASAAALCELLDHQDANIQARALWVLDRIGGPARANVIARLKHDVPAQRALAVRILRRHAREYEEALLNAATDSSDEVRREVLLAIADLPGERATAALVQLAATYDGSDRYQLEAINIAVAGRKVELLARLETQGPLKDQQFALLQLLSPERAAAALVTRLTTGNPDEHATRLLLESATNISATDAGWALLSVALNTTLPPATRKSALEKVLAGADSRGNWASMTSDARLSDALSKLLDDESLRALALKGISRLHLATLGPKVLAVATTTDVPTKQRVQAIEVSVRLRSPETMSALRSLLSDPQGPVAREALRGIVDLQDVRTLREIFASDAFAPEMRTLAVERLIDSSGGALVLLRLLDENQVSGELKDKVIAKAAKHADANVRVLYEKFLPEEQRPKKLGKEIAADDILKLSGDSNRGREIFFKSSAAQCKQCHAVQGFGNTTGPELTNIGKKYERGALLETILEPSKAIAPEYIAHLLETNSGRVYAGFVVERADDHVTLKDIKGEQIRVAADDVAALVPQKKSLMPELVLSDITAQDAADLLEFLTTLK